MKNILAALLFLSFISFTTTTLNAQTLVNKAWQDTTGNPHDTMSLLLGETDGGANFVMVGNTWPTSDSELILITKMTNSGSIIWQSRLASPSTKRIIATDLDISNGYIYITGTGYDSVNSKSTFATEKISDSTGATIWTEKYTPSFTGYAVAGAVREDNAGNVFVSGTEQVNDTSYEMTFIKYNSSGAVQWTTQYDSSGLYNGAVGMGTIASDSLSLFQAIAGRPFEHGTL